MQSSITNRVGNSGVGCNGLGMKNFHRQNPAFRSDSERPAALRCNNTGTRSTVIIIAVLMIGKLKYFRPGIKMVLQSFRDEKVPPTQITRLIGVGIFLDICFQVRMFNVDPVIEHRNGDTAFAPGNLPCTPGIDIFPFFLTANVPPVA